MITQLDVSRITEIQGLTPAHIERRKKYVTASELPALVGLDDYRSAVDLWLYKTGQAMSTEAGEAAAIGTASEPAIQRLVEAATGWSLTRRGAWCTHLGFMGATCDWKIEGQDGIVQGKTGGMATSAEYETEPPARVVIQVHGEMICADEEVAYVAALLGGFGPLKFKMFKIVRDEDLCKGLVETAARFMECVQENRRPEGVAHLQTLKRVLWTPGKVASVSDAYVQAYLDARTIRLDAEKQAKRLKEAEDSALAAIVQADIEAEAWACSMGQVERQEVKVSSYTVDARTEQRIAFKAAKAGKVRAA